ncbi:MAG: Jag N-terminal domain-containing protein [Elusimicrobia bacterium]|nr:Jag N-terminal domain-containing protein [Elusimicrobiota bacterium]
MSRSIEVEGKTVTMAVEKGLAELGLRRDQVEVQVLQEANPGFLGIGSKTARVRLTEKNWNEGREFGGNRPTIEKSAYAPVGRPAPRPAPRPQPRRDEGHHGRRDEGRGGDRHDRHDRRPSGRDRDRETLRLAKSPQPTAPPDPVKACDLSKAWVEDFMKALGATVTRIGAEWEAAQMRVRVDVETPDAETIIGKDGKTLEALQFLSTLIVSRRLGNPVAVQIETDGYWADREESILTQVHQAIEEVKRTGKLVRLQPMDSSLRRMVHRALAESPDVDTVSEGEGAWRKVVLRPKKR